MFFLRSSKHSFTSQRGFTLLDVLLVTAFLGILGVLSGPVFLTFLENHQLRTSQDKIHQAIRDAQSTAIQTRTAWRFGIRENDGSIEWSVYKDGETEMQWHVLSNSLQLDNETTLRRSIKGIYSTKFDHKGNAKILGRITLTGKHASSAKRCVIVSTLIGTTRQGTGHTKPNSSGRHCY